MSEEKPVQIVKSDENGMYSLDLGALTFILNDDRIKDKPIRKT